MNKDYKTYLQEHPFRAFLIHIIGLILTMCLFLTPLAILIWSIKQIVSLF